MNVDPNSSSGNNDQGDKPSRKVRINVDITPLEGLLPPPRTAAGHRVRDLFKEATPAAYKEIGDLLYQTESRPLQTYIGYRTAADLSPTLIPLAIDIMKLHSLPATEEFISILAQREYGAFLLGDPPSLKGDAFAPLRARIADFAVSPDCYFTEKDWVKHAGEILRLTTYPVTILRGCAGPEVDQVLVRAATRGGIDEAMNRRALDLLLLREESDQRHRVLSPEQITAIAQTTNDLLRDEFNRIQVIELVDRWLGKERDGSCLAVSAIREIFQDQWSDCVHYRHNPNPGDISRAFDTLRLLRHFDDLASRLALDDAAQSKHVGISLFARLCVKGADPEVLSEISSHVAPDARIGDTLRVLRIFGCRISPEVDEKLWPIFDRHASRMWMPGAGEDPSNESTAAQRVVLLQGVLRRFYTERFDSPFLGRVFSSIGSTNLPMGALALNMLVQAVHADRIPPPTFYDNPQKLGPLQAAIQILANSGRDETAHLAQGIQELFVLKGPAAYGFELTASESDQSST